MTERVTFEPFVNINGLRRVRSAISLNNARNTVNRDLAIELPYVDKIYQSPIKAFRRIGYVATQMNMGKGSAYVIHAENKVQGVAARVPAAWTNDTSIHNPTELSYWIRKQNSNDKAIELGSQIVNLLMFDYENTGDAHWMVTLPEDTIKQSVCEANGLVAVGQPKQYRLFDGVTKDRQLWIK